MMADLPMEVASWSVDDVGHWLLQAGFDESVTIKFKDAEIDGECLMGLTERMVESLLPSMKFQIRFLQARKKLEQKSAPKEPEQAAALPSTPGVVAGTSQDVVQTGWPVIFKLPTFPASLLKELEGKSALFQSSNRTKQRNDLVRCLVDAISVHTWYPNADQLTQVFHVLLARYPFLKDTSNSGFRVLKSSVLAKFAKTRKPLVSVQEIARMQSKFGTPVNARRRKGENDLAADSPSVKKSRPMCDFVSLMGHGEDESSVLLHETWIRSEVLKAKPNWEEIYDRMARTCLQRKAVLASCSTAEALEKFPYLKVPEIMLHECQLRFQKRLARLMDKNFPGYVSRLLHHKKQGVFMPTMNASIQECVEEQKKKAWQPSGGDRPMYDGPDLPTADIPEDLTGPEPQTVPLDVTLLQRVSGYETVSYYTDGCAPPFIPPPQSNGDHATMENYVTTDEQFSNSSNISEEQARMALLGLVSEQCCYGKSAAKNMTISKIAPSSAFHYTLETYIETRSTAWEQEPYTGQPIDSPLNGRAPLPWHIHCYPNQMFHDEIHLLEVPHTAAVMPCLGCRCLGWLRCYNCLGRGFKRCISCHGSGRMWKSDAHGHRHVDSCWRCHGTGRKRCPSCGGDGRVVCRTCHGYKHLKCYINLRIEYRNNFCEHVVEHSDMPSHLVKTVSGEDVFEQIQPKVWPIVNHPEQELCKASHALLNEHLREFHYARIIMQRQRLRMVPVSECDFSWNNKQGRFWVYGKEMMVYAPDYPQKYCCGCNVM